MESAEIHMRHCNRNTHDIMTCPEFQLNAYQHENVRTDTFGETLVIICLRIRPLGEKMKNDKYNDDEYALSKSVKMHMRQIFWIYTINFRYWSSRVVCLPHWLVLLQFSLYSTRSDAVHCDLQSKLYKKKKTCKLIWTRKDWQNIDAGRYSFHSRRKET